MREAIILAGGFGTRLKQVVPDLPKPMAPICGRPFLEILLCSLSHKGFNRVILSLGHMADKIVTHFGNNFAGMELVYEIETSPLGTGGAVRQALPHCRTDHSFVFNGDTYLDIEAQEIESTWQEKQSPIIVAREVPDTSRFGRLVHNNGRITGFLEKGASGPGLINAGCYVLPVSALDTFELGVPFSLELEYFNTAVRETHINLFVTNGHFIDIGIPEDFNRAQQELSGLF